ncbi:MAG: CBS domain-containing protein [Candidatus Heimdallarchaeota archaeon]|nr:CBS domain-containing protein [Candidatus Heimdallarchaeota archaeon]
MTDSTVIDIGEDDVIGCAPNRSIESAILILGSNKFRRLPITKLGKIEGILTITDILDIISKLGITKALKEKISDWMTVNPKRIHLETSIIDAIKIMSEHDIGSLLLIDDNEEMCKGIVTERDILYHCNHEQWKHITLEDIDGKYLSLGFEVIDYDETLENTIKKMSDKHTHRLIVRNKEGSGLYGIISANDITSLISEEREEISTNSNFLSSITAGFVSSGKLTTISVNKSLGDAVQIMKENKFGALPVMRNDQVIGMISERSLLKYLADQ